MLGGFVNQYHFLQYRHVGLLYDLVAWLIQLGHFHLRLVLRGQVWL
jgi:hypothetical protein